jgi:hypothetical protein
MSSQNQGLCWDAGDKLDWGKAQGRAETSALWTPSSWKSSPQEDLLKEQPALHAKSLPIGLQNYCSTGWQISDHWACSSSPPGPCSPKHTPLRPTWSLMDLASRVCQASNPQMLTVSAATRPVPLRPAQASLSLLGQAARLPSHDAQSLHDLCFTRPCPSGPHRPEQSLLSCTHKGGQAANPQTCMISTLPGRTLQASQAHSTKAH